MLNTLRFTVDLNYTTSDIITPEFVMEAHSLLLQKMNDVVKDNPLVSVGQSKLVLLPE